jgi:AcrR family transcriptional regulator
MPKRNRKDELLQAALQAFQQRGYDGTSVADIVEGLGMSKAALGYHVDSKEQLLFELVEPFIDEVEECLDGWPRHPSWPEEGREMLAAYLGVLLNHRSTVIWIDADKAVLQHPVLGKRLAETNRRVRESIRGDRRSSAARLGASAVLGALWRPLRDQTDIDAARDRDVVLATAMAVVDTVRRW